MHTPHYTFRCVLIYSSATPWLCVSFAVDSSREIVVCDIMNKIRTLHHLKFSKAKLPVINPAYYLLWHLISLLESEKILHKDLSLRCPRFVVSCMRSTALWTHALASAGCIIHSNYFPRDALHSGWITSARKMLMLSEAVQDHSFYASSCKNSYIRYNFESQLTSASSRSMFLP